MSNAMIGRVAKCGRGILGVIAYSKVMGDGSVVYHGVSFGGEKWQSKMPRVLANSLDEYLKKEYK